MIRLGVLGSTRGTNMLALIDAIAQRKLAASINIVMSNKSDALILARAASFNIPAQFINPQNLSRKEYDQQISLILHEYRVDLIVLIGYMRILSAEFVQEWEHKIINVHPSLLPAFAGKMDLDVHRAVLAAKITETGCSVHQVTAEVDAGPVLVQKKCRVLADDTPETLKQRVQSLEGKALIEAIAGFNVGSVEERLER